MDISAGSITISLFLLLMFPFYWLWGERFGWWPHHALWHPTWAAWRDTTTLSPWYCRTEPGEESSNRESGVTVKLVRSAA